ncbi:T9SS type A sorting domain-containing protein [Chryseobacterium wangxinyae]|uniref:T9SS type A sorting domain-containing protein n=1 Tax=Chryseobacterium sp. CY350 TaxID=2997336 RepID=UPI00226F64C0|nr:T9SS type A sorting domain-containing protein [Chryseobacterium sp. CY350]MCY0978280.1 T9SS type A sorting domain-containing protein [Chryseobacterium sp. CY350]WBZ96058.1 T9SS type A sorting domain-containing protein [Chryseobacterium sp. CY350]
MKKLSTLFLSLTASFYFSQQAGDIFSFEQKLNLTPQGVAGFLSNNLGEQNSPDFVNYLNGFDIGLKAYKITYYTKNENNNLVKATGLLMYPNVNYKLSTVVSDHGTTDSRDNVPSNLRGVLYAGFVVELSYVLNGYILMAPDYVGMGSGEGVHPYVHYPTEASATIDFVTAANKVLTQLNVKRYDEYFLAGYSQGAHAAMSTLKKLNISNPSNLKFKYAYMGDGPYDFSGVTLQKGVFEKDFYPFTSFIANVLNTCNKIGYQTYTNNISEVISPEYLERYNYHVLQDNGGLLWGPFLWRKLFTNSFVNDVTYNSNNELRKYLKSNDVYDWYNKTPMTLGHSTIDLAIHPENTSKTIDTQRGYYPWWDLNKHKLEAFYWGPLGHIGGIAPFVLASNAKFNTLRSGGLLNQWAMLTSKQSENQNKADLLTYSQIKPDLKSMTLLGVTDMNKEKSERKELKNNDLSLLEDGIYLLKVSENNNVKTIPYVRQRPKLVTDNEIVKSENNNILSLKINPEELILINIFDENKNLIKSISQDEYSTNNGINLKNIESKDYTFEILTSFYSLQFNKRIGSLDSTEDVDIFTENNKINIRLKTELKNVIIYSISGTLIQNQDMKLNNFESKALESGVYVVQITTQTGKVINRKIKI